MFDFRSFLLFATINDAEQEEQEEMLLREEERRLEEEEMQREKAKREQDKIHWEESQLREKQDYECNWNRREKPTYIPPMEPPFSEYDLAAAQEASNRRASVHQATRKQMESENETNESC